MEKAADGPHSAGQHFIIGKRHRFLHFYTEKLTVIYKKQGALNSVFEIYGTAESHKLIMKCSSGIFLMETADVLRQPLLKILRQIYYLIYI